MKNIRFYTNESKMLVELAKLDFKINNLDWNSLLSEINWESFLKLAVHHKLVFVVKKNLNILRKENSTLRNLIPTKYMTQLEVISLLWKKQIENIQKEIKTLSTLFATEGMKTVFLKGMSMERIYCNETVRYYQDIDLLIRPEDFIKVHKILTNNGYFFMLQNEIRDDIDCYSILEMSMRNMYEIADYNKRCGKMNIGIDLQKADNINYFNLLDFYLNSEEENGINYLTVEDRFIYSCYHAWHHYPDEVAIRYFNYKATLKDYMDIRESYLFIMKEGIMVKLCKRIEQLGCQKIVNNMLSLTERLFGKFCERNNIITCEESIVDDCEKENITSYFERRLFYPDFENEILSRYHQKISAEKKIIKCNYTNNSMVLGDKIDFLCSEVPDLYTPYGLPRKKGDISFAFSTAWNLKYFIVNLVVYDNKPFWGDNCTYNPVQDKILFVFNNDWDNVLCLQIKKNKKAILYKECKSKYETTIVKEQLFRINILKKKYEIVCAIPWQGVDINPLSEIESSFLLHVWKRNQKMFCFDKYSCGDVQKHYLVFC